MKPRRRSTALRVAAALAATALVVASCGSDDDPSPAGPTEGPTESAPETAVEPTSGPDETTSTGDEGNDDDPTDAGPTDGPVNPTVAPVEPTDDPTDGPTEPPQRDDRLDDIRTGIYALVAAGDTDTQQMMDCPLTATHDWQSTLHESGHPQVQIGDIEVEFVDDHEFTGVACTGYATPDGTEVGVALMVLDDTTWLEDLLGEVADLMAPVGPGPEEVGGNIMADCTEECLAIWYLEDLMVVTMLYSEGAETGHIAEITRTLVPGLLDAAEQAG